MTPSPYDSPRLSAAHPPWPGAFEAPPPTAASALASPRGGGAGTAQQFQSQPQQQQQQQQQQRPSSKKGLPLLSSASLPSSLRPPSTASSTSKPPAFPSPSPSFEMPPRSAAGWSPSSPRGEKREMKKKERRKFISSFNLARRFWNFYF